MIEPIEEVGRQRAGEGRTVLSRSDIEDRKVLQRQNVIADDGICCLLHLAAVGILSEPRDPGLIEPLLECSALVSPVLVIVTGSYNRADTRQMGRMADGGQHLRRTYVGTAEHTDLAVGVGQRGGPLDGVVAIFGLMLEGVPLALGSIATAHILRHDHEAALGCLAGKDGGVVLAIGRPL